jgi:hypothetical protein
VKLQNTTYAHELHIVYAGDGVDSKCSRRFCKSQLKLADEFSGTFSLNYADNSVKYLQC